MVAFAYLVKQHAQEHNWLKLAPLFLLGLVLCLEPIVFRQKAIESLSSYWAVYFGFSALIVGSILALRQRIAARLPAFEVLDDFVYKAIAVGFAFSPSPPSLVPSGQHKPGVVTGAGIREKPGP